MTLGTLDGSVPSCSLQCKYRLSAGQLLLAIHIVMMAAVLIPFALVNIPALVDYPNHLARMHVMTEWASSPELQRIYDVHISPIPNIAMDVLVPLLAKFVDVIAAAKMFAAATVVLFVASTVALQRAIQGRICYSSIAGYLVAFNASLGYGFLNYLFGIGVAVLLFAVWIALQRQKWWLRLATGAAGAIAVFFCHVIAFACYGLLVVGYEAYRGLRERPPAWVEMIRNVALAGLQFAPAALILIAIRSEVGRPALDIQYATSTKSLSLVAPAFFTSSILDLIFATIIACAVAVTLRRKELQWDRSITLCVAGLSLAVLLTPSWLSGNWGNDFRLMAPLTMLVIAASRLKIRSCFSLALVVSVLAIFAFRLTMITGYLLHYDAVYRDVRSAAAALKSGSRILPASLDSDEGGLPRALRNAPALLLLDNAVFVPTLFTSKGRQPISVRPAYANIDIPHGAPMPLSVLKLAMDPASSSQIIAASSKGNYFHHRFAGWPAKFDYVLMFDSGHRENPLPDTLIRAASGKSFTLYQIKD